jgi:hypothetical protein
LAAGGPRLLFKGGTSLSKAHGLIARFLSAQPGRFALAPAGEMLDRLRRDYAAMAGMIFGEAPRFDDVIASIRDLEMRLNEVGEASP